MDLEWTSTLRTTFDHSSGSYTTMSKLQTSPLSTVPNEKKQQFHKQKMRSLAFFLHLFSLVSVIPPGSGDRIRDRIYHVFGAHTACFRRLNGTQEIGCQSRADGNVGVLHYIQDLRDVTYVAQEGPHHPYIAIISAENLDFYNVKTFRSLESSKKVNGIILIKYENDVMRQSFSPDKECPNEGYGLQGSCSGVEWNPSGSGLLFEKWDIPIFMLYQDDDIQYLLENCTLKFNGGDRGNGTPSWPLCAAEMKSFMSAAVDSPTCIRRSTLVTNLAPENRCDELGDDNVWTPLDPEIYAQNHSLKSTIVIAARMDASDMFSFSPGTETTVTGIVTLMMVAEALNKLRPDLQSKRIFFILFNGESFDYIGSNRIVYDMQLGQFPRSLDPSASAQIDLINLSDIELFVELSQLGALLDDVIYLHANPSTNTSSQQTVSTFAQYATDEARSFGDISVSFLNFTQELPPSSLHSFLRADNGIPGVVFADHKREYHNRYYNSLFDTAREWNNSYPDNITKDDAYHYVTPMAKNLQKVATVVARSVYRYVTGRHSDLLADMNTSANLMYCYTNSSSCPYWTRFFDSSSQAADYLPAAPLSLYVGSSSKRGRGEYIPTLVARKTLGYVAGDRGNQTKELCQAKSGETHLTYLWIVEEDDNGNTTEYCVISGVGKSPAESPAFLLNDFSGKYPSWTESIMRKSSLRIFLQPNPQDDINTLAFGLAITFVATIVIYFTNRSANDIFHVPST